MCSLMEIKIEGCQSYHCDKATAFVQINGNHIYKFSVLPGCDVEC
jgi:hypothetical protein